MQVIPPRGGGLDAYKKSVVACVLLTQEDGTVHKEVRPFGTMTVWGAQTRLGAVAGHAASG
jgi:hypothetical protein